MNHNAMPLDVATVDFVTYQAVCALLARSDALLDSNDLSAWPDLFTEDGEYQLQSRENADAGWPLSIMHLTSQGMLRDRIYAVQETLYHDPYSQRHICGSLQFIAVGEQRIEVASHFLVIRTQRDKMPQTLAVGRYADVLVKVDGTWKFAKRHAVFDNDLLPNSVIKPI
jgi:salicylate 5-hydroxylase small subunit